VLGAFGCRRRGLLSRQHLLIELMNHGPGRSGRVEQKRDRGLATRHHGSAVGGAQVLKRLLEARSRGNFFPSERGFT